MTRKQRLRRKASAVRRQEKAREAVPETRDLYFRTLAVRAQTVNEEERSVEAVIATEQPVPMFDYERWEMVPEVLLMSGAEIEGLRQIPFLNAHARYSVNDQLGSARGLSISGGEMSARLFFSRAADDPFTMVREGHITDVSVGYTVIARTYVPAGQKQKVAGRTYEGPVSVVTRWKPREVSLVPIGADDQAKLRGIDPAEFHKRSQQSSNTKRSEAFAVDKELRAALVARGMDPNLTDEQAQRWMLDDEKRRAEKKAAKAAKKAAKAAGSRGADDGEPLTAKAMAQIVADTTRSVLAAEKERVQKFRAEVDALCEVADVQRHPRFYELETIEKVREAIIEQRKNGAPTIAFSGPVEAGQAQRDKHVAPIRTALLLRCAQNVLDNAAFGGEQKRKLEDLIPEKERAAGWEQYRYLSLVDLGIECLRADGYDERQLRSLTRSDVAIAALGWPQKVGLRSMYPAYHTTGSFPLLTQDAVHKSMQVGYQEFPATWRGPMRQGTSAPDFKTIHRMRLGAAPNPQAWPDNSDPAQVSFADADEPYAVEAYSEEFGFSWRLMVNDDLDVLSRAPSMFGMACSRLVNATAWSQVTANPTMSDGQPLFCSAPTGNRQKANLITGQAGPPSTANLQLLINLMMQQRGENTPEGNVGADILALMPRYIVGPSALYTTIMQFVKSAYDPAANEFMVFNTGAQLTPVIEPLLDLNSTTRWYVFASTAQIDTVEVTFLQGQETPVTRDWIDERSLSHNWAVLQTFGTKALNHRGIAAHNGA